MYISFEKIRSDNGDIPPMGNRDQDRKNQDQNPRSGNMNPGQKPGQGQQSQSTPKPGQQNQQGSDKSRQDAGHESSNRSHR